MNLLLVFIALAVVGQAVNVMIAMQLDRYSEAASLAVFFALLVTVFWTAWKLALRLTEPGERRQLQHRPARSDA
jgi:hypothetical protein